MNRTQIVTEQPPAINLNPLERLTQIILERGTCMFQVASLRLETEKTTLMALPTSQVFVRPDDRAMFEAHLMDAHFWLRKLEQTSGV